MVRDAGRLASGDRSGRRSAGVANARGDRALLLMQLAEAVIASGHEPRVLTVSIEDFAVIADYLPKAVGSAAGDAANDDEGA